MKQLRNGQFLLFQMCTTSPMTVYYKLRFSGCPTLVGKALSFTHELYFFYLIFYQ